MSKQGGGNRFYCTAARTFSPPRCGCFVGRARHPRRGPPRRSVSGPPAARIRTGAIFFLRAAEKKFFRNAFSLLHYFANVL